MRGWSKGILLALLAWHAADSAAVRPDYLAYFGPQVGGPEAGYQHLVDSSLDWGMDLPALKRWLDEHNPGEREPVFLAYFGNDSPSYHGIKARRLPGFYYRKPREAYAYEPGYYAISATLFQGIYVAAFGRWNEVYEKLYWSSLHNLELLARSSENPALRQELLVRRPATFWENEYEVYAHLRFGRLCAWLRTHGEPPHHVGHSIFIWKLDSAALKAALLDPPVEMVDAPPEAQRLLEGR